jgi:hypothetical protein
MDLVFSGLPPTMLGAPSDDPDAPPPPPPFTRSNIITPSAVGGVDGTSMRSGKQPMLDHLCSHFGVPKARVFFFDGA